MGNLTSVIRFKDCSMFILNSICPVYMAKFLYDLGCIGTKMYPWLAKMIKIKILM